MSDDMNAVYLIPTQEGGVYEYRSVAKPVPKPEEVLVRVHGAGTNRGELLLVPGFKSANPALKPAPSGVEFAGEIVAVGADVVDWAVGDRVMGRAMGSYADYVAVPSAALMRIPEAMTYAEAAAVPNVFVTAHDALVTNAQVQKGDVVLVTAASSGIGTAAIQLAKLRGASMVIASTRRRDKAAALKAAGADVVVDTSEPDYTDQVDRITDGDGVDIVIDSVGGPMFSDNLAMLAVKGRIVSVGRNAGQLGKVDLDEVANKRAQVIGVTFRTRSAEEALRCHQRFVEDCLDAFTQGSLRPVVDRVFPFMDLHAAHEYMLTDQQVGKIVIARD